MLLLKFATTLVDLLLFSELMLHLSLVKQMYNQPIHIIHDLILCIQITRRTAYFIGDSKVKSPCWRQVLEPLLFHYFRICAFWSFGIFTVGLISRRRSPSLIWERIIPREISSKNDPRWRFVSGKILRGDSGDVSWLRRDPEVMGKDW